MRTLQLCNSKVTNESIQLFALYHTELSVLELDGCIYIDDSALYSLHRCSKLRSLSLSGIDNVTGTLHTHHAPRFIIHERRERIAVCLTGIRACAVCVPKIREWYNSPSRAHRCAI